MTVNLQSIRNIAKESSQIMLYGWGECRKEALKSLRDPESPIKKTFNFATLKEWQTLENRKLEWIPKESSSPLIEVVRECKISITNLILENYKRKKEGLSIIPLFFCIHMEKDFPYPLSTAWSITTRDIEENKRITHKELRRCYKLYSEFESLREPILKEIAAIAMETFKFINIKNAGSEIFFEEIDAPWESEDWKAAWQERMSSKETEKLKKQFPWREQLIERIRYYSLRTKNIENLGNFGF